MLAAFSLEMDEDELDCLPLAVATTSVLPPVRVLLIEDSEEAMFLVRYALAEYGYGGYHLEWAHDLGSGLEQLSSGGVDVVLLDLGLPDSSGPESFAWVRELAPETPVVVLTADDRAETEVAVTAKGADGFLVKEKISSIQLLGAIRNALDIRKQQKSGNLPNNRSCLKSDMPIKN